MTLTALEQHGAAKPLIRQLADFAVHTRYEDLPSEVIQQARLLIMDTLGVMLAASSSRYSVANVLGAFADQSGGGEATVVGRDRKTSLVTAALVNGTLAYFCDLDAHHVEAVMHPAAVVLPAVLASAERESMSGRELIAALVIGIDLACRVSKALNPAALYAKGQHPTAIAGGFGSAAAAGRIFGLDCDRMTRAWGLAGTQASGLLAWENDDTEHSRPFNMGIASRNGTYAAVLASLGFGGPPDIFEGRFNLFGAFGKPQPEHLVEDLGRRFSILELAFKRHACCAFIHPGIDGLLEILSEFDFQPAKIEKITLRFPLSGVRLIDNNELRSHCAQYILPIAVLERKVEIDDILRDRRRERGIASLSGRTEVIGDPELDQFFPERYTSIVEVTIGEGQTFHRRVEYARGTPENPATPHELRAKFMSLAQSVISAERAEKIAELSLQVDQLDNVRILTEQLSTRS